MCFTNLLAPATIASSQKSDAMYSDDEYANLRREYAAICSEDRYCSRKFAKENEASIWFNRRRISDDAGKPQHDPKSYRSIAK